MCKAPLSAILSLPSSDTSEKTPVSHQDTPEHPAAAALKQQSTLWRVMVWWDKLFCTHFLGTKALKLRHSHITSPLTRFTVCVSLETQLNILLSFFWDPHWSGSVQEQGRGAGLGMLGEHSSCTKQTRTCHCTARATTRGTSGKLKAW